jgi:hypothetical protein
LIAVTMVLIFDQLIPPTLQPAFLTGSQLRPMLSMAGQSGVRSLPPEATAYIDQLKAIAASDQADPSQIQVCNAGRTAIHAARPAYHRSEAWLEWPANVAANKKDLPQNHPAIRE